VAVAEVEGEDKAIDSIFVVDIVVNFNVAFTVTQRSGKDARVLDSYERAPLKIAQAAPSIT